MARIKSKRKTRSTAARQGIKWERPDSGNGLKRSRLQRLPKTANPRQQERKLIQALRAARQSRRSTPAVTLNPIDRQRLNNLQKAAQQLQQGDTQSTTALGMKVNAQGKHFFYLYSQTRTFRSRDCPGITDILQRKFSIQPANLKLILVSTRARKSGRHAETLIWKEAHNRRVRLQYMAASQMCCADCGGFLSQRSIKHLGASQNGSEKWWDPIDNVNFSGNRLTRNSPGVGLPLSNDEFQLLCWKYDVL